METIRFWEKLQKYVRMGDSISLLRNTTFSKLKIDKMKEFQDIFKDDSLSKIVDLRDIKTEIKGPTLMVILIAIYI